MHIYRHNKIDVGHPWITFAGGWKGVGGKPIAQGFLKEILGRGIKIIDVGQTYFMDDTQNIN